MKKKTKTDTLTPTKLGYKVTHVNFKKQMTRGFKNLVGLCELNEKRIYVEKKLPDKNHGSKKLCLNHELVHARIGNMLEDHGFSSEDEERYVEMEAICWTRYANLSAGEIEVKNFLTDHGRLNIRKKGHRREIVENIFKFLKFRHKEKILAKLTEQLIIKGE